MTPEQAWAVIHQGVKRRNSELVRRDVTDKQLAAVNATMADVLMDKNLRLPVLRVMLRYEESELDSSADLTLADANALLSAAYPGRLKPGVDDPDEGFVKLIRRAERSALKAAGQLEMF